MPSRKQKAAEKAVAERRVKIVDAFDKASKSHNLRRKWIPDLVFVDVINKIFDKKLTHIELNDALRNDRGSNFRAKPNESCQFCALKWMVDPTIPIDHNKPRSNERNIHFYHCCNRKEQPVQHLEPYADGPFTVPAVQIPQD